MTNNIRRLTLAALVSTALVGVPTAMQFGGLAAPALAAGETVASTQTGALPHSFASLVAKDKPAVVTVEVKMTGGGMAQPMRRMRGDGVPDPQLRDFLQRYFGGQPGQDAMPFGTMPPGYPQDQQPESVTEGLGSGFIIDKSGLIVTNNHVAGDASEIRVVLDDGTELPATLVGRDEKTDLAVIKVEVDHDLPTVSWGDSDKVQVGDWAVAIGNPFGLGGTVTAGIVSARGRDLHAGPYDDFLQVDAAINQGNSGGPLVNENGDVIGVNSAIYSPNGGNIGLGFSIPSNMAKDIVAKLENGGTVERGYLGVSIQPVDHDIASAIGLDDAKGALIAEVNPDTPAQKAELAVGDVVTGFGGEDVGSPRDLSRLVANAEDGQTVTLDYFRNGQRQSVDVTIEAMPSEDQTTTVGQSDPSDDSSGPLGLALSDLTPQLRQQLQIADGEQGAVVAEVDPKKAAAEAGIEPGDVIMAVGGATVSSSRDAADAFAQAERNDRNGKVLVLIERDGHRNFVAVDTSASVG